MKEVGIKVLKDNLSRYLRLVRNGETVFVKDRNEIIAEIRKPSFNINGKETRLEYYLSEQERLGNLIRAKGNKSAIGIPSTKKSKEESITNWKKFLDDIRSDRF